MLGVATLRIDQPRRMIADNLLQALRHPDIGKKMRTQVPRPQSVFCKFSIHKYTDLGKMTDPI
jgi:hypothetical protein